MKRLIIFDLDGTLAESKMPLSIKMADLLKKLLEKTKVAVISGASYSQIANQFVKHIHTDPKHLSHLYLLPANGTTMYTYSEINSGWERQYKHSFSDKEIAEIMSALYKMEEECKHLLPENIYGEKIEDRDSQITFSAVGQTAPIVAKKDWDPNQEKRKIMKSILDKYLTNFEVSIGGMTSIDITKKGYDKEFGIKEIMNKLNIPIENVLYIGDAIFPGGNDYGAVKAGVETFKVKNVQETEEWISNFLNK